MRDVPALPCFVVTTITPAIARAPYIEVAEPSFRNDAFSFARKLVRKAAKSIVIVDNYCDDTTLDSLAQKRGGADVTVATTQKSITQFLTPAAVAKFNKQNPTLAVKAVVAFHDRFLILDGAELYHIGASLKDLGRKYCAVTKMDALFIPSILQRI